MLKLKEQKPKKFLKEDFCSQLVEMIFYSHGCGNVLQVKKRKSLFCFWKTFNNIEYIWKLYNIYVLVLIANTNDMFFSHIFQ